MFLPMSCTSPLTVAMRIFPAFLCTPPAAFFSASMNGSRYATAFFITRARFHHLRQKHFAGTEQIADDVHAGHERAFDDEQRLAVFLARFLGVLVNEIHDALHQRVAEAFLDRAFAPFVLDGLATSPFCFTDSANLMSRSVASGRRLSSTSSTSSSRSLGTSS